VPGWTDESAWIGAVPFERMPRTINPPGGVIVTANHRILPGDDPYIGDAFSDGFRAERIVACLGRQERFSPEEIAAIQSDTVSEAAQRWVRHFQRVEPLQGAAERARAYLAAWDGDLQPESGPALLYGCFRRRVARLLFEPVVGSRVWEWLLGDEERASEGMVRRWLAATVRSLGSSEATPDGRPWRPVLAEALAAAWEDAVRLGGPSPEEWRWAAHHRTHATHTLEAAYPNHADALNPPRVGVGGDGDTVRVGSYRLQPAPAYDITGLPVYRQVVDFAQIERSTSVIPGGSSGQPGDTHFADQLELWRTGRRIPMRE
jgi:penicillin amidase